MPLTNIELFRLFLEIVLAVILGAAVGVERELQGKPAGLRTYSLVSLGACLFTIVSMYGFRGLSGVALVEPSRVAANIVVGIGFLGTGLIFLKGDTVYGLTTAAGLWISAALGTAVGAGLWKIAILAAIIVLLILTVLKAVEKYIHPRTGDGMHHDFW